MIVTDLDGNPVDQVISGKEYLVPTVYGIPVICPSHIDDGTDGPTGRHWHTDDRWGSVSRGVEYWGPETHAKYTLLTGDVITASIIKDQGEPVTMEKMMAEKNIIWPSGGVFTSLCWLYLNLGDRASPDGHCVHHRTRLVEQEGCFTCPAHGLKYKKGGGPRFKAPYYLSVRYIDWNDEIKRIREPLRMGDHKFSVQGNYDTFPLIRLEDSDGETIDETKHPTKGTTKVQPGCTNNLTITIGAWPLDGFCPDLAPEDPR